MTVNVRFICREVVGDIRDGEYELPEGQTIKDFLSFAEKLSGRFLPDYPDHLLYMINYRPARFDSVLEDGDLVFVLRKASGG